MAQINQGHDYQEIAIQETFDEWFTSGYRNVLLVAPTGAGKTIIKALVAKYFLQQHNPNAIIIIFAHRDVLLSQISLAAAKVGLPHKMLCSKKTERQIGNEHMEELGQSYLTDNSTVIIASVPTWQKRDMSFLNDKVSLWLMDESHHCLKENMWGKAVIPLNNALGLGVTATPKRSDGKGLGSHNDGVFETIVKTPGMGELIQRGRLSPYKVYTIPNDLDVSDVNITSSGDYNQRKLDKATRKSHITGDAIEHYTRLAPGKQAIIFAASVGHSDEVASQFRAAGYTAESISSYTDDAERHNKIMKFRAGKIQILVNYDLFGEGFDVPAVEVVILLRKTMSYGLFKQMFGRVLRVFNGKPYGILIDHVGNVREHQIPGKHLHEDPEWTLDRPDKRKRASGEDDGVDPRVCPECFHYYTPKSKGIHSFICPSCGHAESSKERIATQKEIQVKEGLLVEFDTGFLKEVYNKIDKVDIPVELFKKINSKLPTVAFHSAVNNHQLRQESQNQLRPMIGQWCDQVAKRMGLDIGTTQTEFQRVFGVDVYTAQTLSARESSELRIKIRDDLINKMFDSLI